MLDVTVLDRQFDSVAECQAEGPKLFGRIKANVFSEKVKDTGAGGDWECRVAR